MEKNIFAEGMNSTIVKQYSLDSVVRVTSILRVFSNSHSELTLTEITKMVEINKTTVFRMLQTLRSEGFLFYDSDTKKYSLGPEMFRLSSVINNDVKLNKIARPFMTKVSEEFNETTALYVTHGNFKMVIEVVEGTHKIQQKINVGEITPLYTGAIGQTLIAHFSKERREKYFKEVELIPYAPKTITDRNILEEHIEKIAQNEFGVTTDERISGTTAIAAPIISDDNNCIAVVAILALTFRLDDKKIAEMVESIKLCAHQISYACGRNI